MPAAVAVPSQSPGALDIKGPRPLPPQNSDAHTVADVKGGTNLDHVEIEGVEPVNSMSSDAVEIKGEHNHRPIRIMSSCSFCDWINFKRWAFNNGFSSPWYLPG